MAKPITKKNTPAEDAPHLATARKWRPQVFGDIVGQAHITTTLQNAIGSGRLSHSYLFSGPRGVGKTTTARILARAINCLHPKDSNPDNTCELCVEIAEGRSVNVFEIDGASNRGVEEIRNLREAVRYGPGKGAYKVYIIDEVHMLTKEAFNALLKTLEEPPSYVIFIFATTEVHKVPLTILSRCQRFEFHRIASAEIVSTLAEIAATEKVDIDAPTLELIARRADGSLRDSQSIFDQIVSYCDGKIRVEDVRSLLKIVDDEFYFRVTDAIAAKDAGAGFAIVDEVSRAGHDLREFAGGITEHFRNLLVVSATGATSLVDGSERLRKKYAEAAKKFSGDDLLRLMKISSDAEAAMRWSQQPRIKLELGLSLMIRMDPGVQIAELLAGIDELKKKVESSRETGLNTSAPAPVKNRTRESAEALLPLAVQSPAPVRGSVRASQPTLRPDQMVTTSAPVPVIATMMPEPTVQQATAMQKARTETAPAPDDAAPPPAVAIFSGPGAAGSWRSIIEEFRKEKMGIGTMLGETSFHAVRGNSVSISCPDDFHADLLKRNRHYISSVAERLYGAKIHIDTILAENPAGDSHTDESARPNDGAGAPPNGSGKGLRHHPLVKALITEFGAEEIR
jgi:DNA polymerase-3 subunit gamma/tau